MPYVKLDSGILDSTLWIEDLSVRVTFLTMLAMADFEGVCHATAPGIARRANMSLDDVRSAIKVLESPDAESRSQADDGRRVTRIEGGYNIVNYQAYRDKDHTAAARMRAYRERQRNQWSSHDVTRNERNARNVTRHVTEADTETNNTPPINTPPTVTRNDRNGSTPDIMARIVHGLDQKAFSEWDCERRSRGGKSADRWSPLAQTKAANLLARHSPEQQQAMVDAAIAGGWDGLHAPNSQSAKDKPKDTEWKIGVYK